MSATALLCEIIGQGGKVAANFYLRDSDFAALVKHGYLREAGVLSSVVCDECAVPHSASVVFDDGVYGYFCPDLGFVRLGASGVTAISPDIPTLINRLALAFGCRQRKSSTLHGQIWRIGMAEAASVMLYFQPTLQSEDNALDLQSALAREARSVWRLVVTARGGLPISGLAVVRLDDLVEIDTMSGDLRGIVDLATLAGVPRKKTGGRPRHHGDLLKPLIDSRIHKGEAFEGVNAEAREVRAAFEAAYPDRPTPSDSAIKRYIRKARGGS